MNDTNKSWAWWKYFICVGIILIGIFAGIELINMFGASSGEYGSPITIETVQGLEVVENYDFGILELNDIDGDNVYTLTASYAPIDFNGTQTKYSLMFNSQPVQNIKLESGAIAGSLTMTFYNTSGTEKIGRAHV